MPKSTPIAGRYLFRFTFRYGTRSPHTRALNITVPGNGSHRCSNPPTVALATVAWKSARAVVKSRAFLRAFPGALLVGTYNYCGTLDS